MCGRSSSLILIRAVKSAVFELAGMMLTLDEKMEGGPRGDMKKCCMIPSLVQKMDDHGMLYGLPQAEERLQFLLDDNRPLRTFDEEFKQKA